MLCKVDTSTDFSAQRLDVERLRRIVASKEPGSALLSRTDEDLLDKLGALAGDGERRLTVAGLLVAGREEALRRYLPGHEAVYLRMQSDTGNSGDISNPIPVKAGRGSGFSIR
jgi:hypothetical protein